MKLVVPGSSKWGFSQHPSYSLFGGLEFAFQLAQRTGDFAEPAVQFKNQKTNKFTLKFYNVTYKILGSDFQYDSENSFPLSGTIEKINFKNTGIESGASVARGMPQKLNASELEIAILKNQPKSTLQGFDEFEYQEKMLSGDDVLILSKHEDEDIDMGEGNDEIISPKKTNGRAWVAGGPGADIFVLQRKGDGHMWLRDFSYLEGDKIKLPFNKDEYEVEYVRAGHPYVLDSSYVGFQIRREGNLAGIVRTGASVGDEEMSAELIYESMI